MPDLLTCPIDGTPLVMAADAGMFETACHRCRREFRLTRGRLTHLEVKPSREGYRSVSLSVHVEHETVEISDEVLAGRWSAPAVRQNITIVEELDRRGNRRVVRLVSGNAVVSAPHEPGDRALIRTAGVVLRSSLSLAFVTILAVYFYSWFFLAFLLVGLPIVVVLGVWRWRSTSTRRSIPSIRLQHLKREQWLLTQLERYRLQSDEVAERLKKQRRQIGEMEALARDMEGARGDYQHRLDVVRRGISALHSHEEIDERLRSAIADAMEMVEIEYRASRALEYLPDDAMDRMSTTIAELDAIRAEGQALESQLEANAEVHAIAPG